MVDIVDYSDIEADLDLYDVPPRYEDFQHDENIPIHTGLAVENVNKLSVDNWDRTGQQGAFLNLYGTGGICDNQIHVLEPSGETTSQRHFYEEMVYVTQGTGVTVIGEGDREQTFEWQEQSLFHIPRNVPYRHINMSEDTDARLLSQTDLPQLTRMIPQTDFIFNDDYDFWGELYEDFYSGTSSVRSAGHWQAIWDANFIPDVVQFDQLDALEHRGAGGTSVRFEMPHAGQWNHVSEFPVGTYKKAHRHGPGATVVILSGVGFSLIWAEGWDRIAKIDWEPYSMFVPPAQWYHQHFNTGEESARYLAIHNPRIGTLANTDLWQSSSPVNQIEYVDEDPMIRELYEAELGDRGLESRMPDECYVNPEYDF